MIVRPPPNDPNKPVRIIRSIEDSTLDKFVSADVAYLMYEADQIKEVDLGPRYPWSFMYV
jgi:hypothetical protein